MPKDLFHPSAADEKCKHKLKRLIQAPNSFFMDVKCPGCFHITTIFSHAQVCFSFMLALIESTFFSFICTTFDKQARLLCIGILADIFF